jgi:hypothetical protein
MAIAFVSGMVLDNKDNQAFSPSQQNPGTDVMILKIFSPKKIAKKLAFLALN